MYCSSARATVQLAGAGGQRAQTPELGHLPRARRCRSRLRHAAPVRPSKSRPVRCECTHRRSQHALSPAPEMPPVSASCNAWPIGASLPRRSQRADRLQPAPTRLQAPSRPSLVSLAQTQQARPVRKSCATRSAPSSPQPKWAGPHRIDRARTGAWRAPAVAQARGGARARERGGARRRRPGAERARVRLSYGARRCSQLPAPAASGLVAGHRAQGHL
jgi:hypothetical protein